jgi:predicted nuclease of predicted toxin-antitoxin system
MKILLDANISWKLVNSLKPIFGDCAHVDFIGLNVPVEDINIWNYAQDNDFVDLLELNGYPPKIVLLKTGNNSSQAIIELRINVKPMIEDLEINNYGLLEIIKEKI